MAVLGDIDILKRLEDESLEITPLEDVDQQVQPASVDLRLGEKFLEFKNTNISAIDPRSDFDIEDITREVVASESNPYVIHPGDFVLATTKEHVEVPADLFAEVQGRSSIGRLAVIIHATAGIIDPGYKGQITLELSNLGNIPIKLHPGMRISQIKFTELKRPADRPYGEERGSKYQGQTGPTASQLSEDPEFEEN